MALTAHRVARVLAIEHHHLKGIICVEGNIMLGEPLRGCAEKRSGGARSVNRGVATGLSDFG